MASNMNLKKLAKPIWLSMYKSGFKKKQEIVKGLMALKLDDLKVEEAWEVIQTRK